MEQDFDKFGQPEIPYFILTNPNREELYFLSLAYNTKITKRFNALSEFSFDFPKSIDGVNEIESYQYIQNKRLVLVENHGYFQIINAIESMDGSTPIKSVECQSLESDLLLKRVTIYSGTKPLWGILDSEGTVLQDMINLCPNWSVGHVDPELLVQYRTFDVSDTNVYEMLMNEVSKAFECVFIFDTVDRTINAYTIDGATTETDIFLSFDNVISKGELEEKSDEITTVLAVYGGGTLSIRNVNPLGSDKIYDFSYYKTTDWMSQSLVDAITDWEDLIASNQAAYSEKLASIQSLNETLLSLQAEYNVLNNEYQALVAVQAVRIQTGQSYEDILSQINLKLDQMDFKSMEIQNAQTAISQLTDDLEEISDLVSFENNFTPSQLLELNSFMFENTYKNENIIETDSMTPVQVQEAAQNLYNQAAGVLSRVSQPRYEFSTESINYTVLSEFSVFTSQTNLGSLATIELENGNFIETVLLEISYQFDDPTSFSMVFSNRLRLDGAGFTYSDLMGQVVKTGSSVSFDSSKWSNWENYYKNSVTTFITSSLNAAVNNVVSNDNQDIAIDQHGLRARQWNADTEEYDPKQIWMVNNMMAFSDDGFQTARLALGEIESPDGGTAYGLVADVIVGRLLAGNSLTISNDNNNFILDSTGATLNNAKFNIQTTNTQITIDPTGNRPFRILRNEGGTWVDKFWVNNAGNVNFAGTLSGANGTFSGTLSATTGNIGTLVIDSNGLKTADGNNFLKGNGNLKWGGLSIIGGTATFTGDIYANKIVGQIVNTQIAPAAISDDKISTGVSAGKITTGSMAGDRIYGGTIGFPGVQMGTTSAGYSYINATGGISLNAGNAGLDVANNGNFNLRGTGSAQINVGGSFSVNVGNLYVDGFLCQTIGYSVTTPYGTRVLTFRKGLLIGYS